jgi:hypothetical protein
MGKVGNKVFAHLFKLKQTGHIPSHHQSLALAKGVHLHL